MSDERALDRATTIIVMLLEEMACRNGAIVLADVELDPVKKTDLLDEAFNQSANVHARIKARLLAGEPLGFMGL